MQNPFDVFMSWQTYALAVAVYCITQFIKVCINLLLAQASGQDPLADVVMMHRLGAELRKEKDVINKLVLPAIPVWLGVFFSVAIPIRPESVITFAHTYGGSWFGEHAIYAFWGGFCGQFADYLYSKVSDAIAVVIRRISSMGSSNEG